MAIPKMDRTKLVNEFEAGSHRLVQSRLDFLLPHVKTMIENEEWLNLRPEYQRRLVWDQKKRSLLVESFLLNIPVPPVFLYEHTAGRYEVMDGQQRLNAIVEFLQDKFKLTGLTTLTHLNGLQFQNFPDIVKRGLTRRNVSAVVIAVETSSKSGQWDLRRQVFERLNTGGKSLNSQELRNCLYSGNFNKLIIELSCLRQFTNTWGIPPHSFSEAVSAPPPGNKLRDHTVFTRMSDCEWVLRFFAFRDVERIKGSVTKILDSCMEINRNTTASQITQWREDFKSRLDLAIKVFGDKTFRIQDDEGEWNLSIPLYDAVMIALDRLWAHRTALVSKRVVIASRLNKLLRLKRNYELVVAKANTAADIKRRLDFVTRAMRKAINR